MYDVIGVNGEMLHLKHLPEEQVKETLSHEVLELLGEFGPMKRQLILSFFSDEFALIVLECLNYLLRLKKVYEFDNYISLDARYFEEDTYSVPKVNGVENTFEKKKNFYAAMEKFGQRQRAFAVYLYFRDLTGARRWYLNKNRGNPWLLLSFIAKEKLFYVMEIKDKDYQDIYAYDAMADPRDLQNRLVIIRNEEDKEKIIENGVKGVAAFVTVDENYIVTVKKP